MIRFFMMFLMALLLMSFPFAAQAASFSQRAAGMAEIKDIRVAKQLIRKVFGTYKLPYISITPTFSICNQHGYIAGEHFTCPTCGAHAEVWSRVVGYLRPVQNYNTGKREEYAQRKKYVLESSAS